MPQFRAKAASNSALAAWNGCRVSASNSSNSAQHLLLALLVQGKLHDVIILESQLAGRSRSAA